MKKTTNITRIIAIAAVTIFISCKKEIARPQTDLNGTEKAISAAQVATPLTMSRVATKTPGYIMGTNDDSTTTR
ncbi:MAG: hypothetical protein ABIO55_15950 [Ginsengibacter sp.]